MPDSRRSNDSPKVSIVIVTHNSRDDIESCLRAVLLNAHDVSIEVLVVDNASSDDTVDVVGQEFPMIRLMQNRENVFFARANNQALREAKGEYVLILNPDTIMKEDTIRQMVDFMDIRPDVGAASCAFVDPRGKIIPTCWRSRSILWLVLSREPVVRLFKNTRVLRAALISDWDRLSEREVDVVSGAFLFARHSAVRDIGYFDERFLLYLTDDDICGRLWKSGHKVLFNPRATVSHLVSRSTLKKPLMTILKIQRDDFVRYFRKHHGRPAAVLAWVVCGLELLVWWTYLPVRNLRIHRATYE